MLNLGQTYRNSYLTHEKLADTYYALERYDEALASYRAYLAITGDDADPEVVARVEELESRSDVGQES